MVKQLTRCVVFVSVLLTVVMWNAQANELFGGVRFETVEGVTELIA